mgnify:CR=1 FL=1
MLHCTFLSLSFPLDDAGPIPVGMTLESDHLCLNLNDATVTMDFHQREFTKTRYGLAEFLPGLLTDDLPRQQVTKARQRQRCDVDELGFDPKEYLHYRYDY